MNCKVAVAAVVFAVVVWAITAQPAMAADVKADPSNYHNLLAELKPGDTMILAPGQYGPLTIKGINGTADAWITITGPTSGEPALIAGEPDSNTVEIVNSSFVAIEHLRINSRGIPGAFGISAKGGGQNRTHDIRIEGNILVGQNGSQQTDGISTKIPTWGWIIRNNQILQAGTGIYLGNSDGSQPFVHGLIENNLIAYTIGYNMEIKDQNSIPEIPGMPTEATSTIIRNNVFIKDDAPSPDGDRPNLLVGGFPSSGIGSLNRYEIYGNYFFHNHREALFQGSGRISLHDNIFVDGPADYAAVVLRRQNFPLYLAYVYDNTIYTTGKGIYFGTPALTGDAATGNLVFASLPISGPIARLSNNLTGSLASAITYVNLPSFDLGSMDFYPRPGKCEGTAIDLKLFREDSSYNLDFNGTPKTSAKGATVFRGAYAGSGANPGWQLQEGIKPGKTPSYGMTGVHNGNSAAMGSGSLDKLDSTHAGNEDQLFSWSDFDCGQGRGLRGPCVHNIDAHAIGLLLWQSAAGEERSATQ
jgi:hypothetical protein